ncbi:MAG: NAD(P)/FAD-dependent oxidoreductase [Sandaracinaceae bacterium]|nr:NAD(P)/FAD-dependent oxidoreductase [Sandaracinaceae bacterium]
MSRSPSIGVIGGGPGGSSFALYLTNLGVDPADITIVDQATFPRPKLCGGGLTNRGTELVQGLLGAQPLGGGETRGLEFRCALGAVNITEKGPQWLYDRGRLDNLLLGECKARGVRVIEGARVREIDAQAYDFRIRTGAVGRAEHLDFDWLVGADGARGVTGRALGLAPGIVGRLIEAVFEPVSSAHDPSILYFDFDPILDGIPGYAWIFPYPKPDASDATGAGGAGTGVVPGLFKLGIMDGRGVTPGAELKRWTMAYAERNGFRLVDDKLAGWPEHYYAPSTRAHVPGAILVGEAWGIDPLLGEGIAPALETAAYGATRLREALDGGTRVIRHYERRFKWTLAGRNLWFQAKLANLLYGPNPNRWLRVLFENQTLLRLASGGTEQYGRLAKTLPRLLLGYAGQVLRKGIPSNRPIALPASVD